MKKKKEPTLCFRPEKEFRPGKEKDLTKIFERNEKLFNDPDLFKELTYYISD